MNGSSAERIISDLIDVAGEPLRGRQRLDIIGVQAVEGAGIGEREPAAFGRVGIGVGQMGEVRAERRLAMHGDGVRGTRRIIRGRDRPRSEEGRESQGGHSGAN